ncbi:MAG: hypothetical protein J5752_01360 [Clostridiales bacterium]|nr:hypothetical protein [Clostridiales bacterium]
MAKNCPGCGAPMEYDPSFDSLVCQSCGNIIDPKSLPDGNEFYLNYGAEEPVDIKDVVEEEELTGEMYDCHIYTCSQCGGEVIVSGTEVSTRCIYCGSTAVVFNRIAQECRPQYIVPFKVTKEEALKNVRDKLLSGFFVPSFFKKTEPSVVRGIYIPYYLYEGWYKDTQRFQAGETPYIYDCECDFEDLPVEACKVLADKTTAMLEPYYLNEKVDFDTSYLMGFYSNIRDLEPRVALGNANLKARAMFDKEVLKQVPKTSFLRPLKRVTSVPKSEFARSSYALLPAWFITINKDSTPYTFLVNGQTGKVVGTVPWNRFLIGAMITVSFATLAFLSTMIFVKSGLISDAFGWSTGISSKFGRKLSQSLDSSEIYASLGIGIAALGVLGAGFAKFKKVLDNLNLSRSIVTFIFSKKRQGDAK